MVEQPSWSCHKQVDTFLKLISFSTTLRTADYNSVSFVVVFKQITSPFVVLHCKLARRCDNNDSRAIFWREVSLAQQLNGGHHVSQSFTGACFCST